MDLSLGTQLVIVGASIMAAVGVAGVPEAGLIVLPLVLSAAGLPDWLVLPSPSFCRWTGWWLAPVPA